MPSYIKGEDEKKKFEGAKPGDIITFNPKKAYPDNDAEVAALLKVDKEQVKDLESDFSFQITEIRHYQPAPVDEKLFERVFGEDVKTEAEFRQKISDGLKGQLAGNSDYKFMQDVRKYMEEKVYSDITTKPFKSIDAFVAMANEVLNRRKSRAGKSLEHHLADIFIKNDLLFEEQVITEENKKPDFVFPNGECYHNLAFPGELLTVLGAKTTCKDRWRQVLNEADRVDDKYLFTLQQGISSNQLKEMQDYNLHLVVSHKYLTSFPKEYRSGICDLSSFIVLVKEHQEKMPKHYIMF